MKRLVLTILVNVCFACCMAQTEKGVAMKWLQQIGMQKKGVSLTVTNSYDELTVFEDQKSRVFVIVVNDYYASVVDNRVLAYSASNIFSNPEGSWSANLISSYRQQLRTMKEHGLQSGQDSSLRLGADENLMRSSVSPLLGNIRWGQAYPFNELCPASPLSNSHKLAGCVAVAVSQVMLYHKYPMKGMGSFAYTYNGRVMEKDFSSIRLDWSRIAPSYAQTKSVKEDWAQAALLVEANAVGVSSSFGDTGTSSAIDNVRPVLVNLWGYSPGVSYITDITPRRMEQRIRKDLLRSLPVVLTGGGHAFVCDGCEGSYLHFNLGWYGAGNGYYRMLLSSGMNEYNDIPKVANALVCGIEPRKGTGEVRKTVAVYAPGTLKDHFTREEIMNVTSLTVSGKLNGEDVLFLRRLLGATDMLARAGVTGSVTNLDITDAEIITDEGTVIHRISASHCKYGEDYDFERMTPDVFKKFRRTNMSSGIGYRFVETDRGYFIDFYTVAKTITPMMFAGCQNLRKISLPNKVSKILGRAFFRCSSLDNVEVPSCVSEVETGAFAHCYMLRRVVFAKSGVREVTHGLSPVKTPGAFGAVEHNRYKGGILDGNDLATCDGLFLKRGTELVRVESIKHSEYMK